MLKFVVAYLTTNDVMAFVLAVIILIKEFAYEKRTGDITRRARFYTHMYVKHWWLCIDNFFVNVLIVTLLGGIASAVALNAYYDFLDYEESLVFEQEKGE